MNTEHVVLVDDHNNPLGTVPKATVHTGDTPLHRGFSVFLFDKKGRVLFQQRSHVKKTWPLVWSGSCCGHPALDESVEAAIRRRASFELGIEEIQDLTEMLPTFRYQCVRDGVMENEICPVWVGNISADPLPNPDEVEAVQWLDWQELTETVRNTPGTYSQWCEWEVEELNKSEAFIQYCAAVGK